MDAAAMRAQVERLEAHLAELRAGHDQLQRSIREVQVTVTSADQLVTVTVDARGQVERVELDSRIYQRPDSRHLAATITATIQQASAEAMAQVTELVRPYLPSEALQAHLGIDLAEILDQREAELLER
jgi:DNA-binding protein YbaB